MPLNPATRDKLQRVSTPTLATALYKRGLRQQFIQDVYPLSKRKESMVGEAFTLRYIPAREDLNPLSVFRDRGHLQRKAIEECPPGAVLVIDSRKDARAASAGGILITRLMVRGAAGVVTDGGFATPSRSQIWISRPFIKGLAHPPILQCIRPSKSIARLVAATRPFFLAMLSLVMAMGSSSYLRPLPRNSRTRRLK